MADILSAEAIDELRGVHREVGSVVRFCDYCETNWPCEVSDLLAAYDAALKERDEARSQRDDYQEWLADAQGQWDSLRARSEVLAEALREARTWVAEYDARPRKALAFIDAALADREGTEPPKREEEG